MQRYHIAKIYHLTCANSPWQFWNTRHILRADSSLDVDWVWLDLLKVLSDVEVVHLDPLLLPLSSEREEVAAVSSRHRCLGVVFAVVQNMLQLVLVPPREVVTVKHLCLHSHI